MAADFPDIEGVAARDLVDTDTVAARDLVGVGVAEERCLNPAEVPAEYQSATLSMFTVLFRYLGSITNWHVAVGGQKMQGQDLA